MDLTLLNKHWKDGFLYPFPEKRNLYSLLEESLKRKFITSLIGLRRIGKTTLLKQLINYLIEQGVPRQNVFFYSFDEPIELTMLMDEYFKVSLQEKEQGTFYFFLDEIQKLPEWQNKVKPYYDHYPNFKFVISGSSSLFIRKKSESLAGRIEEFLLSPLSFSEFLRFRGKKEFISKKNLFASEVSQELEIFSSRQFIDILHENKEVVDSYLDTLARKIIFEDIPLVYPVEQPQVLLKIFTIISATPGMLLDYRSLSSDLAINEKTLSNYVYYLEMAFLIKKLYNYSSNYLTSEKKLKKVYPLASSFCRSSLPQTMESLAVTQMDCSFFWRKTHEVDCIVEKKGKLLPIEVKYTNTIKEGELKGLKKFMEEFKVQQGIVLTKNLEKKTGPIHYFPLWKWLLEE